MAKYVMALDAGTTSNRCILFNEKGEICSVAQKEFTQHYPKPGWVEHDADEIWATQLEVAQKAMANIGAIASDIAAIGSQIAADYYGVPVLEKGIQDKKNNQTRFLVIGKNAVAKTAGVKYKTSLVISVNNRPGALYDMLVPFNQANINLTRIESRPSKTKAWSYNFFVDLEGHLEDDNVAEAVSVLKGTLPSVKWLGSYPM